MFNGKCHTLKIDFYKWIYRLKVLNQKLIVMVSETEDVTCHVA